jgi:hypothetical protein
MVPDFSKITERAGDPATYGQIADMFHRYRWASEFCNKSQVLEVACGTDKGWGCWLPWPRACVSISRSALRPH